MNLMNFINNLFIEINLTTLSTHDFPSLTVGYSINDLNEECIFKPIRGLKIHSVAHKNTEDKFIF